MKWILSLFLLLFALTAGARPINLSWDHYTDTGAGVTYNAADYMIMGSCRVVGGPDGMVGNTPAANDTLTIDITANPGDEIACKIAAQRKSSGETSAWTPEVSTTYPLDNPTGPTNLKIHF